MTIRAWSLMVVAVLSLAAIGPAEAQKVTLFVANRSVDVAQAWYTSVPQHLEYFKEEGLEVEVQTTSGGLEAAQFVVAGRGQFSLGATSAVFQLREKGLPYRVIYQTLPRSFIYPAVLDAGSIKTAADLKGKKIGVTALGSATIPYIKAALAEGGLDPEKDLTFLAVGGGAQAAHALSSGAVDALGLWDSQYAAVDNVGVKLRRVPSRRLESLAFHQGLMTTDDIIQKMPEAVEKLGRAIAKGSVFTFTNPEASIRIHWKVYPGSKPQGVDEATALRQASNVLRARLEGMRPPDVLKAQWGATTRAEVESMRDFLLEQQIVKSKQDPEIYFTSRFVADFNRFDAAAIAKQAREWRP